MQVEKNQGLIILFASFVVTFLCVLLFVDPIPQSLNYHNFADTRPFFGIANFGDVASNISFLVVGLWGIWSLFQPGMKNWFGNALEGKLSVLFFASVALVSLGSAYYHEIPGNDRLFWDRLPMTVAFMSLFSLIISDRIDQKLGKILAWILIPAGILSLVYWSWTENLGHGDLRFYGFVQFYPIFAIPLMCYLFRDYRYTPLKYILWLMFWYAVAKVLEFFDVEIFDLLGNSVSGHSLKHLCSALSVLVVLRMLQFMQSRK